MGSLDKTKTFFFEFITLSSPRAILSVISFLFILVVIIPVDKLFLFPIRGINKYIYPFIFGRFFDCPTQGFLENCCPSCGLTRASSYLLHGNIKMACYHNPLIFLIIPLILVILGINLIKILKKKN